MTHLDTACKIAKEAGQMILAHVGGEMNTELKSSSFDVVTEIDQQTEVWIRSSILQAYPEHRFLGEEETYLSGKALGEVLEEVKDIPFLWIVDPIDGTANFVHGIPGFTVSIALAYKGELVLGVVYDPTRDELFSAEKGKGAYLNGKRITVSEAKQAADCAIATGFVSNLEYREQNMRSMVPIGAQFQSIRALGSAALHMAYVACGRFGAFWVYGLNVWDVAGGIVLVKEAGGMVTDVTGRDIQLTDRHYISSNGLVHATVVRCLEL